MFKRFAQTAVLSGIVLASQAQAHFQLVYTPETLRERGGQITLKMPFTHPAASGHVMTIDKPEQFFSVRKGKKTDLLSSLQPIQWTSAENTGPAWEAPVKLRGLGDHIFVLQPAPYLEAEEDAYIQQITKTIINVGSLPSGWNEPLGLKAEIVPLTKPYAVYEYGTFTGVVQSEGKAVPFAEIEVEFINYTPDMQQNAFAKTPLTNPPAQAFVTQTIYADANGTFTFGFPNAGHWGFAALGVGPDKEYNGKELSQDAVIWVQAHPLR
ncbi:MAG: DUF4198 domain-containing protein [Marinobacterium sp.]|nr:DUF4198 domain-containing protein [Marinobacterium sp.]